MLIGYARVSTSGQDLAALRDGLATLGIDHQHVHVERGLSGTTRAWPGLREALTACRPGDVLVVTKLDRIARSLREAIDIAGELTKKGVELGLGGAVYDPTDPAGRLFFNVLGMVDEFEDLIRARPVKLWRSRRPLARSVALRPSALPGKRSTRCSCTVAGSTRPARSRGCLASPTRLCTGPSSEAGNLEEGGTQRYSLAS
ncbi:recombinase family protein [Frigoribacterium sp. NBH87]|uniref:recombinase family protein n=1 Tax=Frigoribacterium sp. NBH87 TaxID=2596916 RepID=UPI00351CAE20